MLDEGSDMREKTVYVCQTCGYEAPKWLGRCPGCGAWNTLVEERRSARPAKERPAAPAIARPVSLAAAAARPPAERLRTGLEEFDRVLGGGLVPGSLVLLGGEPGIGKSTLASIAAARLAGAGRRVLYAGGEESEEQIRLRLARLGVEAADLYLLADGRLDALQEAVETLRPAAVIVDSVQTMRHPELASAPGSVAQVREGTAFLLEVLKPRKVAALLIGHVTKEGTIAGPRVLEHLVDAVLYFEGERYQQYRVLRAVKNRFGPTNELGLFEMTESGLVPAEAPTKLFLRERSEAAIGAAVTATMEGSRPMLLEVQALLVPTLFPVPRRSATGFDLGRLHMLLAVLEKRAGLHLIGHDAYVNVVGGLRISEPAADLAVALAIASSFREAPVAAGDVFIGEIGLSGEVRPVPRLSARLAEAARLGFRRAFVPPAAGGRPEGLVGVEVRTVREALEAAFGR
ncbi:MAG: DNA repair protein RadA [Hydrogenibacillus schlegelii]|uniref:DNA repair protein RadA n=2 Tax=Hydrogenibacillus schlegelii TaxID=1484 RepID=A0A2T5G6X6_HYDSH|nr:DNA repair protein RadA [Hydrogenibacillus schlegelii]PTQ51922.1 MAG: DNA repair protein RadA [Hydrogenibacillus schlegelii]